MPRPAPPPHPIQPFLALLKEQHGAQLSLASEKRYLAIIRRMEKTGQKPDRWLAAQAQKLDGTSSKARRSTIGVMRSAVSYYLRWTHYRRTGEVLEGPELKTKLTKASSGVKGELRSALSGTQYIAYGEALDNLAGSAPQIQAVLRLLPHTGLRISEACGLRRRDVVTALGEWTLHIVGKGQQAETGASLRRCHRHHRPLRGGEE